jgi:hypothetical protein
MGGSAGLAVALAAAALFASAGRGVAEEPADAAYEKARNDVLPRLRAFAAWCGEQELGLERDRAFEGILALAPDDVAARRALRYVRGPDGTWTRPAPPKRLPTDPARAAEVASRRETAVASYRVSTLAFIDATGVGLPPRERALEELVAVDPDCARARELRREVKVDGRWLLEESVAQPVRLKELVAAALTDLPAPARDEPTSAECMLSPHCVEAREASGVRVIVGRGVPEGATVAKNAEAARRLLTEAFGVPVQLDRLRIFLFSSPEDAFAVIDRHPSISKADRAWARSLSSLWVGGTDDALVWSRDLERRVEWGLRQAFSFGLRRHLGIDGRRGWAWEGLTQWASQALIGKHACYFVRRTRYSAADGAADDLHATLFGTSANWMTEARKLEAGNRWPDLRVMLGRPVDALTPEEVLQSYALSRLLVEGRAGSPAATLRAVSRGDAPDVWVGAHLGMTVDALDRRLRRFLREIE